MTLQQLRYVVKTEQCGSLRKAAKELFVSQPNLSKQLAALEEELGIEIFKRVPAGLVLTEDGRRLIAYANEVLRSVDSLAEQFHSHSRPSLSVSSQHFSVASEAFCKLQQEMPKDGYELTLRFEKTADIIADVATQRSEVGLLVKDGRQQERFDRVITENNLEFNCLSVSQMRVFLSREHPLAKKKEIRISDLRDYPSIAYTQNTSSPHFLTEELLLPELKANQILHINDLYTSVALISQCNAFDFGTGFMPQELHPDIISRPLDTEIPIEVGYLKLKNAELTPLCVRLIGLFSACIRESKENF